MWDESPEVLERCATPRGELQLQRRGEQLEVISNGTFLMSTSNGASERELVRRALAAANQPTRALIGGLGVGYSLLEALRCPLIHRVTVVEIEDKMIAWHHNYFSSFTGLILDNPRTEVIHADFIDWMRNTNRQFDVICLDIDNGPDWVVTEDNLFLYTDDGLERLSVMLDPDGVLAFWSACRSTAFAIRLRRHFPSVMEHAVDVGVLEPDYVYLAKRATEF